MPPPPPAAAPAERLPPHPTCREEVAADGGGGSSSSFERKVRKAKRAARSELSVSKGEWRKHGYATTLGLSPEALAHLDTMPRLDAARLCLEEFVDKVSCSERAAG